MTGLRGHLDGEVIRFLVARTVYCPLSGAVLDVHTISALRGPDGTPLAVISSAAAERLAAVTVERFAARGITVDGRPATTTAGAR